MAQPDIHHPWMNTYVQLGTINTRSPDVHGGPVVKVNAGEALLRLTPKLADVRTINID